MQPEHPADTIHEGSSRDHWREQGGSATPDWLPMVAGSPEIDQAATNRTRGWQISAPALVIVCLVIALAVAVALGEWASRTHEMSDIVAGIEASETAMTSAMADMGAIVGEGDIIAGGTDDTADQLKAIAERARGQIADASAVIQAVSVQPWHADVEGAREAYLAHSQAWQEFLTQAAQDPAAWSEPEEKIESTWLALAPLLTDAVPYPAVGGLSERVAAILDDGGSSDDGGPTINAAAGR
jgi:hypothetical protein